MSALEAAIAELQSRPCRLYVAATGAGAGIQSALWSVPGASTYLAGCTFPYAADETEAFLGYRPEKFVSAETAMDLAIASYIRASDADVTRDVFPVGLGVTAAVATNRVRRGVSSVHVACVTRARAIATEAELPSGEWADKRREHGRWVDEIALEAIAVAMGSEPLERFWRHADHALHRQLFARPYFAPDGRRDVAPPRGMALFPGAFHPPHTGHFGIADSLAGNVAFTLCRTMPHKGDLSPQALLERVRLLRGRSVLMTEGDPLYIDKALAWHRPLVIGADAFVRMFEPRWGDPEDTHRRLVAAGARFLVVGRMVAGRFVEGWEAIRGYEDIATALSGRWDVSSSDVRARANGHAMTTEAG